MITNRLWPSRHCLKKYSLTSRECIQNQINQPFKYLFTYNFQIQLGERVEYDATNEEGIAEELASLAEDSNLGFQVAVGNTVACNDFYEGKYEQLYGNNVSIEFTP